MSPPRPAQRSTDPVPVLGKVQFSRSQEQGRMGIAFFTSGRDWVRQWQKFRIAERVLGEF